MLVSRGISSLLVCLLVACGSQPPESGGAPATPSAGDTASTGASATLAGAWMLVALGDGAALAGQPPTLAFEPSGRRASGDGGCNRFSGPYEVAGDALRFGALVSTRRACAEEGRNAQEAAFMAALAATRAWSIAGDTLRLRGGGGEVARLVRSR